MTRILFVWMLIGGAAHATTFTVNSTLDTTDANAGDGVCETATGNGVCTLRAALTETNALAGPDTIMIDVNSGIVTISPPPTPLMPEINEDLAILATGTGYTGTPRAVIDCQGNNVAPLQVASGQLSLKGLAVINCYAGVIVHADAKLDAKANYFGVATDGVTAAKNLFGVLLVATHTGPGSIIGGTLAADRNVIAASVTGVDIDTDSSANTVQGNYIGVGADGTTNLGTEYGIYITAAANNNIINSNLISGSSRNAVWSESTNAVTLSSNLIGTDAAGNTGIGNAAGVRISGSNHVIVDNLISGSADFALDLESVSNSVVLHNYFGTNFTGTTAIANTGTDIVVNAGTNISIGDGSTDDMNVICSGNIGIFVHGTSSQVNIDTNLIGIGVGGQALGNSSGIDFSDGSHDSTLSNNVVSANHFGMVIEGAGSGVHVTQNRIGSDRFGNAGPGNENDGLLVSDTDGVIVDHNLLVGNYSGLELAGAHNCSVLDNQIGTDGTIAIGNTVGIYLSSSASNNLIGGATGGNVISGNSDSGVLFATVSNNTVQGNFIGTNAAGTSAIANQNGVTLYGNMNTLKGNVISGNTKDGVLIPSSAGSGNLLIQNKIGTTSDGSAPLANQVGIYILGAINNQIGDTTDGDGNLIAFNTNEGIFAHGTNVYARNSIHGNGTLGIDQSVVNGNPDGVTPNDVPDADGVQNLPLLLSAFIQGSQVLVRGTLASTASSDFTIELFTVASCDDSGFGEGDSFRFAQTVQTDASGNVTFVAPVPTPSPTPLPLGTIFTATATRTGGGTSEFSACVTISGTCSPIAPSPSPTPLPEATAGQPYSEPLGASGGVAPYFFTLAGGSPPPGITVGSAISGTPTAAGDFAFTVQSSDVHGCSATHGYSLSVACPTISLSPTTLPDGTAGTNYHEVVSATGGGSSVAITVSSGSLPDGVSDDGSGVLDGVPAPGDYDFVLTANAYGCTASQEYMIHVAALPDLATASTDLAGASADLATATTDLATAPIDLASAPPDLSEMKGKSSSGCSCELARGQTESGWLLVIAVAAALMIWRRRRAR